MPNLKHLKGKPGIKCVDNRVLSFLVMEKIREYRKANNHLQSDMASLLGVSLSAYKKWEAGFSQIPLLQFIKICKHFNFDIPEMFYGLIQNEKPMPELRVRVRGTTRQVLRRADDEGLGTEGS